MMKSDRAGFLKKKSGGRDFGEKGVKNEVFRDFLGNGSFDFVFFPTERRYCRLHMCATRQVQKKSGSPDMGLKGVKDQPAKYSLN